MKKKILFIVATLLVVVLHKPVFAQNIFHGILINKTDSSRIPYAAVTVRQSGKTIVTDTSGSFQCLLNGDVRVLTLDIAAIGIKTSVSYTYPFSKTEKIYVDVVANTLQDFDIKGLSALQVVKKAVAAIPFNYADTSYFNYSFYRRYQKVNNHYVNLFEACPVIMFRLLKEKKEIKAHEDYAVLHLRRSAFHSDIMNRKEDNPAVLLLNPVYHLYESSLRPNRFPNYYFYFDTSDKNSEDYIVGYFCNRSSTDTHGIACAPATFSTVFTGEEYEIGRLVIDRETFAIKKFERKSIRHKDFEYNYWHPNNLIRYHNKDYYFEFVEGDLQVEYALHDGKWYLDKMFRQYTNEFDEENYDKAYTITDNFEWYAGPVARYINGKYAHIFHPVMATAIHGYDTTFWQADSFPFYYTPQDSVYDDLQREDPIEKQFADETKIDGYNARGNK